MLGPGALHVLSLYWLLRTDFICHMAFKLNGWLNIEVESVEDKIVCRSVKPDRCRLMPTLVVHGNVLLVSRWRCLRNASAVHNSSESPRSVCWEDTRWLSRMGSRYLVVLKTTSIAFGKHYCNIIPGVKQRLRDIGGITDVKCLASLCYLNPRQRSDLKVERTIHPLGPFRRLVPRSYDRNTVSSNEHFCISEFVRVWVIGKPCHRR